MRTLLLSLLLATPLLADVIVVPPNYTVPVEKIRISVSTGADDLRSNSTVSAFVILHDGRRIESKALNCNAKQQCTGLPAKSKKTLVWTVPAGKSFKPAQVRRFGLTFRSAKSAPADQWDVTAVSVESMAGGTADALLSVDYQGRSYGLKSGESWEAEVPGPQGRGPRTRPPARRPPR